MAEFRPGTPEQAAYLSDLLAAGLLIETGEPGLYGRGARFEEVRHAIDIAVSRVAAPDGMEALRFPPLLPRRHFETSGYLQSFPHLAGSVFAFDGDEAEAFELQERAGRHEDWSGFQSMSELVLVPAACYPVYPAMAARGPLRLGGVTVDLGGAYVFRHEPSGDPARMQMFHQREMVRIGEPEAVVQWRDLWRDRCLELLGGLGLDVRVDVASDPFFGRSGRLLSRSQRAQELKLEVRVPIAGPEPTAVASFNHHQEHFSSSFGIGLASGGAVHTSCLGFGLERITLALLHAHGLEPEAWPARIREALWPA